MTSFWVITAIFFRYSGQFLRIPAQYSYMEVNELFVLKIDSEDVEERNKTIAELQRMTDKEIFGGRRFFGVMLDEVKVFYLTAFWAELLILRGEIQNGQRKAKRIIGYSLYKFLKKEIEQLFNEVDSWRKEVICNRLLLPDFEVENKLINTNDIIKTISAQLLDESYRHGVPPDFPYSKVSISEDGEKYILSP